MNRLLVASDVVDEITERVSVERHRFVRSWSIMGRESLGLASWFGLCVETTAHPPAPAVKLNLLRHLQNGC